MTDLSVHLDKISSIRSSWARRARALTVIEQHLASICVSANSEHQMDAFLTSQNLFEYNIVSRLVPVLASWLISVQSSLSGGGDIKSQTDESLTPIIRCMIQMLSIFQGVSLLHPSSKSFLGRSWCLQILLDVLTVSRHIPNPADVTTDKEYAKHAPDAVPPTLVSTTLDTLLCVLVDSPEALRLFEEISGLDAVVRTLKRPNVSRDDRMKCLEFLYFYLLPEDSKALDGMGRAALSQPDAGSSGPSRPTFDVAAMPKSMSYSHDADTSCDSVNYAPNPRIAELGLLKKDLEFVPTTPKKQSDTKYLHIKGTMPVTPSKSPSRKHQLLSDPQLAKHSHTQVTPDITPTTPQRSSKSLQIETLMDTPTKHNGLMESPLAGKTKGLKRHHSRGSSMADATLVGTPMRREVTNMKKVPSFASVDGRSDTDGGEFIKHNRTLRSTQEKRELLSVHLGNVNALIEGMKNAGAWGLE